MDDEVQIVKGGYTQHKYNNFLLISLIVIAALFFLNFFTVLHYRHEVVDMRSQIELYAADWQRYIAARNTALEINNKRKRDYDSLMIEYKKVFDKSKRRK